MKVSCLALTITTLIIFCNLGAWAQDLGEWKSGLADYPINKSELHGAEIDGKFYLLGGQCDCAGGGASLEMFIYNVTADSWDRGTDLPSPRHHPAVTTLDGKLYVFGGINLELNNWPWLRGENNAWSFNPSTNKWTTLAPMPDRVGAGAAESLGGKIYVMGGISEGANLARTRVYEYDPTTNTWDTKEPMNGAREHFRAGVIGNRIYVAGGRHDGQDVQVFEAYEPSSNSWHVLTDLPTTRGGVAVGVINERLYVMGGEGANSEIGLFQDVDEYNPVTDSWKKMQPMLHARHGMGGIAYDGKMWLIGGANPFGHNPIQDVHYFTPPEYATASGKQHR